MPLEVCLGNTSIGERNGFMEERWPSWPNEVMWWTHFNVQNATFSQNASKEIFSHQVSIMLWYCAADQLLARRSRWTRSSFMVNVGHLNFDKKPPFELEVLSS